MCAKCAVLDKTGQTANTSRMPTPNGDNQRYHIVRIQQIPTTSVVVNPIPTPFVKILQNTIRLQPHHCLKHIAVHGLNIDGIFSAALHLKPFILMTFAELDRRAMSKCSTYCFYAINDL